MAWRNRRAFRSCAFIASSSSCFNVSLNDRSCEDSMALVDSSFTRMDSAGPTVRDAGNGNRGPPLHYCLTATPPSGLAPKMRFRSSSMRASSCRRPGKRAAIEVPKGPLGSVAMQGLRAGATACLRRALPCTSPVWRCAATVVVPRRLASSAAPPGRPPAAPQSSPVLTQSEFDDYFKANKPNFSVDDIQRVIKRADSEAAAKEYMTSMLLALQWRSARREGLDVVQVGMEAGLCKVRALAGEWPCVSPLTSPMPSPQVLETCEELGYRRCTVSAFSGCMLSLKTDAMRQEVLEELLSQAADVGMRVRATSSLPLTPLLSSAVPRVCSAPFCGKHLRFAQVR